ncbi:Fur family transcriptional regulator [Effusibacillus pohliae]|uniref:Fur family transcriptional regulator n=1 Tax=Effusibacillus pohliae TaxID=232270 RepID=UPI000364B5E2|nr:Fur family transcriptional regulator [Effusibacillus pohliae]
MDADKFLRQLKEQGFKLTGKRRAIVEILLEQNRYISAKELMEKLKAVYPHISVDTVYRNLNLLKEEKIIEESEFGEGGSRFRIRCSTDHHHHLVCLACGRTQTLHECPMDLMRYVPEDFQVVRHRFELLGYCPDCKTAAPH